MLKEAEDTKCYIVVEGKTDKLLYQNFIDKENCILLVPPEDMKGNGKKDNVISILTLLDRDEDVEGVIGIVDDDFWKMDGISQESSNILVTDFHDSETMIFYSEALEKVLYEYGQEDKIKVFENLYGLIRNAFFEKGKELGYLRWVNDKEQVSVNKLTFKNLDFGRFMDKDSLEVNLIKMVQTVKNKSGVHHIQDKDLLNKIEELRKSDHDPKLLSCGHDLVSILSYSLRRVLGTNNANSVSEEVLEKSLRLSYEYSHFKETMLYQSILQWQSLNKPYKVLK
jgi:hypothetical protein